MFVHYYDAENVGLAGLDKIALTLQDRMFVFSRVATLAHTGVHPSIVCFREYPLGPDQADFYIIGHLASLLAHASPAERKVLKCVLHSRDRALCQAFQFQCELAGVSGSTLVSTDDAEKSITEQVEAKQKALPVANTGAKPASAEQDLGQKMLKLLDAPKTFAELTKALKLNAKDVNPCFAKLAKAGVIKRQSQSKKHWVKA
ncbi:hypothetical protein [Parathalassolituus penaei]|uniref:Uncharacterized protein n=1 Tax=Parathalassolituus penaei TaxID=2997323 RepID=A0A9X3ISZ6_9GAMM|nr:hypothetical protein [Parathalassolituus penaei]MCY0965394.1 hypothetical protein [Parathalassolituus penaei]